jgi:hypothetical protein
MIAGGTFTPSLLAIHKMKIGTALCGYALKGRRFART